MSPAATVPEPLVAVLEALDYADDPGLITAADRATGPRDYQWRDLRDKVGLDAAFFQDGVPIVGFASQGDASGLLGVRRRLWNYGRVPLLVATTDGTISAYNAVTLSGAVGSEFGEVLDSQRRANTARDLLSAFARRQVESGRFAAEYGSSFQRAARVDRALLRNLEYLRRTIAGTDLRRRNSIDVIVGGCLTASYLADRGILNAEHLTGLTGLADLHSILLAGRRATRRLFEGLASRFNGDVFGALPQALTSLRNEDLHGVAALLQGDDLPSGQQSLWPYDFSVVPADLVSTVYEQLLGETQRADAAYYTPRFLVDTVLDEVLPWQGAQVPALIDIACGSGAFMTEAFRRLAYREYSSRRRPPTYDQLRALLVDHIFGIDSNPAAARVAVFGLYLALLEELEPPTVWETAVLPQLLGRNVVVADAFDRHSLAGREFDIVVGNPPWQSKLTPHAEKFIADTGHQVADRQLAQAFLWLAADMLRPGGMLGLIMPSKGLLHNRSRPARQFRLDMFHRLHVRAIIDLSAVRRTIFTTAIAPAAVLVAAAPAGLSNGEGSSDLLHVAAHPRSLSNAVDALIITPEEVRSISANQARTRPDLWRVLLWGT